MSFKGHRVPPHCSSFKQTRSLLGREAQRKRQTTHRCAPKIELIKRAQGPTEMAHDELGCTLQRVHTVDAWEAPLLNSAHASLLNLRRLILDWAGEEGDRRSEDAEADERDRAAAEVGRGGSDQVGDLIHGRVRRSRLEGDCGSRRGADEEGEAPTLTRNLVAGLLQQGMHEGGPRQQPSRKTTEKC